MKLPIILLAITLAASSQTVFANPVCVDATSDSDGDGWGWENNQSCIVEEATPTSSCIDSDGDGWGWNGTESCLIEADENPAETTTCIDSDGDGYGWNGTETCLITQTISPPVENVPEELVAVCEDTEPLNDTWGWDGTQSCRIAPVFTSQDTSAIAGLYNISDEDITSYLDFGSDGFYTLYESFPGNSCFDIIDSNGNPENFAVQFSPLGGNFYELYLYDLLEDGTLDEERETYEMFITEDGSLSISFDDIYFDEFGNEVTEPVTDLLPAATDITVADLPVCEEDF